MNGQNFNFLAVDTAGASVNIILVYKGNVYQFKDADFRKASEVLLPETDKLLKKAGTELANLDFFACITGPGSFTGIRIGLSTVKAFAAALNKKIVCLSSFDALFYSENARGKDEIIVTVHGWADVYYLTHYKKGKMILSPQAFTKEKAEEYIKGKAAVHIADGGFGLAKSGEDGFLNAAEFKAQSGEFTDYISAEPYYITESQAERELKGKGGAL